MSVFKNGKPQLFSKYDTMHFPIKFLVPVVTISEAASANCYHTVVSEVPHLFPILRVEQTMLSPNNFEANTD